MYIRHYTIHNIKKPGISAVFVNGRISFTHSYPNQNSHTPVWHEAQMQIPAQ